MAREGDLWRALDRSGESLATEEDYEHGYKREVRQDLERYVAFRVGVELYGLSIRQIAEIAKVDEVAEKTVYTRIDRALEKLRESLDARNGAAQRTTTCLRQSRRGSRRTWRRDRWAAWAGPR